MKKVAIDIGHGSNTFPPSKGVYKDGKAYHEHDFNSKVAVQLEKELEGYDIEVIMYQKPFSKEIGLTQRTNYYNAQDVDVVWSIHANAGNETADGRCAFYWYSSKEAMRLAELFVEEVKNAGYETHGNGLHASEIGSWTNMHICRETKAVAVLSENGFMTNDEVGTDDDFELVFGSKQDSYVKDIAKIHAKAITRFLGLEASVSDKVIETVKEKVVEAPKTQVKSSVTNVAASKAQLNVDGIPGKETIKALQLDLGTTADSYISDQLHNQATDAFASGIKFGTGKKGSMVVKALQKLIGAKQDGLLGPNTVGMLQKYLGTTYDKVISDPSEMVKELQRRLNAGNL